MSRSFLVYAIAIGVFGLLAYFANRFPYFPGDIGFSEWLRHLSLPKLAGLMSLVSYLNNFIPAAAMVLGVAAVLLARSHKREALLLTAVSGLGWLINAGLKLLVNRPRPGVSFPGLGEYDGFGFPSGHTITAVVIYGSLFYLAPRLLTKPRAVRALRGFCLAVVFLTMLSRVYLGAHWPSDVIGGAYLGLLVLVTALYLKSRRGERLDEVTDAGTTRS